MRASMLFTTTAQPTARAEAGTSYSHIAVKIGNNFIELEINNAVDIMFPLPSAHISRGIASRTWYTRVNNVQPIVWKDVTPLSLQHKESKRTSIGESTDSLLVEA